MGVGITERGGRGFFAPLTPDVLGSGLKALLVSIVEELDCCRLCEREKTMVCDRETFRPQIRLKHTKEG